jgi:AcrR family transcriptional regulator
MPVVTERAHLQMTSVPANIAETSDNVGGEDVIRQRKRGAELESAIRGACVAELAECGYGQLTIESVASRAQTGKASIYRRWPTKQQLVMDSVSCLMAGPMARLVLRDFDDSVSTREALLDLMVQVARFMSGPEGDAMRSVMGESLRDPDFSASFDCEFFDPRKVAMLALLDRGVQRGEVRPDAVSDTVVEMLAGTLIHRILLRRQDTSEADLAHMLDTFVMPAIQQVAP